MCESRIPYALCILMAVFLSSSIFGTVTNGQIVVEPDGMDILLTFRGHSYSDNSSDYLFLSFPNWPLDQVSCEFNGKTCLADSFKVTFTLGCETSRLPNGSIVTEPCSPTSQSYATQYVSTLENGTFIAKFRLLGALNEITMQNGSSFLKSDDSRILQMREKFSVSSFLIKTDYDMPEGSFCYSDICGYNKECKKCFSLIRTAGGYTLNDSYGAMFLNDTTIPRFNSIHLPLTFAVPQSESNSTTIVNNILGDTIFGDKVAGDKITGDIGGDIWGVIIISFLCIFLISLLAALVHLGVIKHKTAKKFVADPYGSILNFLSGGNKKSD